MSKQNFNYFCTGGTERMIKVGRDESAGGNGEKLAGRLKVMRRLADCQEG